MGLFDMMGISKEAQTEINEPVAIVEPQMIDGRYDLNEVYVLTSEIYARVKVVNERVDKAKEKDEI